MVQLAYFYAAWEVVDFIIHSVNDVFEKRFDALLQMNQYSHPRPFTGTGTFITRLLQRD